MKLTLHYLSLLSLLIVFSGCDEQAFHEGRVMAGGHYVSAATLNKGKQIYTEYCMACHGVKGDGKGVASKGLIPPPRNFTLGIIKFGDVVSGDLPHDEAVYKALTHGLNGSAMLPWDLKPGQMEAVWQYIKTFAPEKWVGKDKELGEKLAISKDPFGLARKDVAIAMGKKVYHAVANCQSCHRGYATLNEYNSYMKEIGDDPVASLDEDFYKLKPQESDHGYLVRPPDFTFHRLRSVYDNELEDLYLRILAGVGGTSMPAWKDTLQDQEIWAVAYYVQSLRTLKDSPERKEFISKIGR